MSTKTNGQAIATTNGQAPAKRKRGRPPGSGKYNGGHAHAILDQLSAGKSLRSICEQPGMPKIGQVCGWAINSPYSGQPPIPDFSERFAQAVFVGCHVNAMDLIPEARNAAGKDMAGVAAQKLLVDTMKWDLSKRLPDQFGDRLQVQHGGDMAVHVYIPDNGRLAPGDDARVIEGTAEELDESKD